MRPGEPSCLLLPQAFRDLISSGRLKPEQTDVRAYEVDGQVFLAEVLQTLRKHVYHMDTCSGGGGGGAAGGGGGGGAAGGGGGGGGGAGSVMNTEASE